MLGFSRSIPEFHRHKAAPDVRLAIASAFVCVDPSKSYGWLASNFHTLVVRHLLVDVHPLDVLHLPAPRRHDQKRFEPSPFCVVQKYRTIFSHHFADGCLAHFVYFYLLSYSVLYCFSRFSPQLLVHLSKAIGFIVSRQSSSRNTFSPEVPRSLHDSR